MKALLTLCLRKGKTAAEGPFTQVQSTSLVVRVRKDPHNRARELRRKATPGVAGVTVSEGHNAMRQMDPPAEHRLCAPQEMEKLPGEKRTVEPVVVTRRARRTCRHRRACSGLRRRAPARA
mgnify:CR=1 FL=1